MRRLAVALFKVVAGLAGLVMLVGFFPVIATMRQDGLNRELAEEKAKAVNELPAGVEEKWHLI